MPMTVRGLALFLILACGMTTVGCTQIQQQNLNQAILNNQTLIQSGATLATTAALQSVAVTDRPKVATEVYVVANAINKASGSVVDMTGVDVIVQAQLAKWNSPYVPLVRASVQVTEDLVAAYVNNTLANVTDPTDVQRIAALRALLSAASTGAMQGAIASGAVPSVATPATQP